ncbi:uncharacterized protein LOC143834494 [Paroedura picta]|uniref:uncharacterized protein LOC143834494 n=1 Tax=Paroedura picta TaxID=143630 RepID=UPI004057A929
MGATLEIKASYFGRRRNYSARIRIAVEFGKHSKLEHPVPPLPSRKDACAKKGHHVGHFSFSRSRCQSCWAQPTALSAGDDARTPSAGRRHGREAQPHSETRRRSSLAPDGGRAGPLGLDQVPRAPGGGKGERAFAPPDVRLVPPQPAHAQHHGVVGERRDQHGDGLPVRPDGQEEGLRFWRGGAPAQGLPVGPLENRRIGQPLGSEPQPLDGGRTDQAGAAAGDQTRAEGRPRPGAPVLDDGGDEEGRQHLPRRGGGALPRQVRPGAVGGLLLGLPRGRIGRRRDWSTQGPGFPPARGFLGRRRGAPVRAAGHEVPRGSALQAEPLPAPPLPLGRRRAFSGRRGAWGWARRAGLQASPPAHLLELEEVNLDPAGQQGPFLEGLRLPATEAPLEDLRAQAVLKPLDFGALAQSAQPTHQQQVLEVVQVVGEGAPLLAQPRQFSPGLRFPEGVLEALPEGGPEKLEVPQRRPPFALQRQPPVPGRPLELGSEETNQRRLAGKGVPPVLDEALRHDQEEVQLVRRAVEPDVELSPGELDTGPRPLRRIGPISPAGVSLDRQQRQGGCPQRGALAAAILWTWGGGDRALDCGAWRVEQQPLLQLFRQLQQLAPDGRVASLRRLQLSPGEASPLRAGQAFLQGMQGGRDSRGLLESRLRSSRLSEGLSGRSAVRKVCGMPGGLPMAGRDDLSLGNAPTGGEVGFDPGGGPCHGPV